MRIAERLERLEAQGAVQNAHQRRIEADAADFMAMMDRMAVRCVHLPRTTEVEFCQAVRQSRDPFLIDLFVKEDTHAVH